MKSPYFYTVFFYSSELKYLRSTKILPNIFHTRWGRSCVFLMQCDKDEYYVVGTYDSCQIFPIKPIVVLRVRVKSVWNINFS